MGRRHARADELHRQRQLRLRGGGLYVGGTLALTNCTVSGNSANNGGGLLGGGAITLTNTIVAGQTSGGDVSGTVSGTNNLIGTGGSGGLVDGVDGNLVGVADPGLAPLGNYGGTSLTMALLPGSPAIDAGTGAGAPATDQRGYARVGAVDIGAFESQGFTLTLVAGTPQSADIGTPFADPLAVSVTANNPLEPVDGGVVSFVADRVSGATAILLGPLGGHRRRPGRHHRRAQQRARQLHRRRVRAGSIPRLVRPDQHGHAVRGPGREHDERFPLPGPGPPEPS